MSVSCKAIVQLPCTFSKTSKLWTGQVSKLQTTAVTRAVQSRHIHSCATLTAKVGFLLSDIGEGIREVVVKEWYVNVGDRVAQFDKICEVQSDKASVTITSRYDGTIAKLHYRIDDTAFVGQALVDIETAEGRESTSSEEDSSQVTDITPPTVDTPKDDANSIQELTGKTQPVICIPSVRRLAQEYNVNLASIKGTGKNGRILKEDVLGYLEKKPATKMPHITVEDRVEPIRGFQRVMAKTMTETLKVPLFVYGDEINVTKLSQLRKSVKGLPELRDIKLSFLPFFVKAVSNALERYPIVNASVDESCENITYHKSHNIGIAMDSKVGLAVPVIKDAQNLSILDIARELTRLIQSGKDGVFSPSDLTGGTFGISNIGAIGGTYMKPLPLPPQAAIIALGASQLLPRFDKDKNITAEEILNVSASADHRIIDGATMAKFTQTVKRQIENPYLLFLNL